MGKLRTPAELFAVAQQRAEGYAPRPKWDPVRAGLIGAAITVPVMDLMAIVQINPDAFVGATVATVGLGFLVPFGYLKYQERKHSRALSREYQAVKVSTDAERSS